MQGRIQGQDDHRAERFMSFGEVQARLLPGPHHWFFDRLCIGMKF